MVLSDARIWFKLLRSFAFLDYNYQIPANLPKKKFKAFDLPLQNITAVSRYLQIIYLDGISKNSKHGSSGFGGSSSPSRCSSRPRLPTDTKPQT
ncbi:hypothetical protein AAHA92_16598 [Salvia divinorum]|uniref:Uncharacterized protein n=1 Tax=Salvia divinorum TaxID=28513 RepID=A0ABD1GW20_SALDI